MPERIRAIILYGINMYTDLSKIAATLKYAEMPPIKSFKAYKRNLILATVLVCGIAAAIIIIVAVMYATGNAELDAAGLVLTIVGIAVFVVLYFVFVYFFTKKIRDINSWLQDAVPLKANCICVATDLQPNGVLPFEIYKIKVNFKYNGKHYSKQSENDGWHKGFSPIWHKFVGKDIDILYSPKYDQVLILKDSVL